jgi:hypothetical protein
MALQEVRQRGLDQLLFIVTGVGEDCFVLDDLKIIDSEIIAVADELHRFEGAVADIDAPCKSSRCHVVS